MRAWLLVPLWFVVGCGAPSVEDDLTLSVTPALGQLQVDSVCDPSCTGDETAAVHIAYVNQTRPAKDTVEFKQYRVDYTLAGVSKVPYFAAMRDVRMQPGADEALTLQVVGSAQREFVAEAAHGRAVSGTATLEFAGYDFDNRQVFIDAQFDVRFEDVTTASADSSAEPDAGAGNAL